MTQELRTLAEAMCGRPRAIEEQKVNAETVNGLSLRTSDATVDLLLRRHVASESGLGPRKLTHPPHLRAFREQVAPDGLGLVMEGSGDGNSQD